MKYLLFTFLLLPLACLQAQHVLIKKRAEVTSPRSKATSTKTKTVTVEKPVYVENYTNKFTLKLTCNASAKVLIDGDDKGIVVSGTFKKILLNKGKYKLTLISTANSLDQIRQIYEVNSVNTEDLLEIDLQSLIDERVSAEEQKNTRMLALKNITNMLETYMVYVEGGNFNMGGNSESEGKPIHNVNLSSFKISKYEVTQAQWEGIMGTGSSTECPTCPVSGVNWYDTQEFIQKLNTQTGKHYRLPTEAEWEYAARGGNKGNNMTAFFSGSLNLPSVGWFYDNSDKQTHPVGLKHPNTLGLYDMSGNVWEWCSDWYDGDYYKNSPSKNPSGPNSGTGRVVRGGSWANDSKLCLVAARALNAPEERYSNFGLRLVLDIGL